jgi:hypothetical protein
MREDRRCAALCLFHVMKTPNSSAFVFCLNKLGFGMVRPRISLLVGFSLCVFGSAAIAQSDSTRTNADPAVAAAPKAHAKKSDHKSANAASSPAQPNSEAAEKAARLAEGRKKFFERSMGFDNGTSYDSPVTLGNGADGGLSPQMGVKF